MGNPHIPHTEAEVAEMLKAIGVQSLDDLFSDIQPHQRPKSFDLPGSLSELEVMDRVEKLAQKDSPSLNYFIGGGYYDHFVPSAVGHLASRGEFYTAYTPYQPEVSQGTLQALFEFQSLIATLTNMEVANASLYDGATALFEAMMMSIRINKKRKVLIDGGVNPIFQKVLYSYTENIDIDLITTEHKLDESPVDELIAQLSDELTCVIIQNPQFTGALHDYERLVEAAHAKKILVIACVYPISLGLVKTPGEMGVDIVVGEGQSLGLSLNFGGPYLGFMATRKKYIRKMPGRIVGQTVDQHGRRCFVNTLQAREQHIRRDKATSNICTNVSLCALQAGIYMTLLGKQGLLELAEINFSRTEWMKEQLADISEIKICNQFPTFNEFTVELPMSSQELLTKLVPQGIIAGFPLNTYFNQYPNHLTITVTEKRSEEDILQFIAALKKVLANSNEKVAA